MKTYRVGAQVIAFRAVKFAADEHTVISVYPPSKSGGWVGRNYPGPIGIAQTGAFNPGSLVQVAETPGEIGQAEAGAPFEFGAGGTPVIAIARGSSKAAGDMVAVVIAQPGLTT